MASSAGVRDKNILGPGAKTMGRGPDLSQLKSPIQTSLSGTRQVIHALECGTGEVKEYLLDEINLMYECKTCFAVFRSVANLIAHKRTFCKGRYRDMHHVYRDKYREGGPPPPPDMQTVVIEAEPVECVVPEEDISLDNYAPSVELLKTSGILADISNTATVANKPAVNRLLPPGKPGLSQVVSKLRAKAEDRDPSFYAPANHKRPLPAVPAVSAGPAPGGQEERSVVSQVVHLEPMYETDSGLLQSWRYSQDGETLGQTYRAWQEAEADKKCYQVWPNGKVTSTKEAIKLVNGPDGQVYSVRVPFDAFASVDGIDSDDEDTGYTKYPCPTCKKTFSKIMNVFHHMVKVHDIEMHEAKAKRKVIQNQSVYVEGRRKKTKSKEYFERPVKPVLVKLKNYTLDSKVPVNLCDQLNTPGNRTCPILSTNCLSDSSQVQNRDLEKADELNRLVAERDDRERNEEELDEDVDRTIMQYVNRRRVECKINGEQFSRLYILKNYIANDHLKLKRWACKHCDFGCWLKYQCINHAIIEHKYRSSTSASEGVVLRSKEEYFDNNPRVKQNLLDPNRPVSPDENGLDNAHDTEENRTVLPVIEIADDSEDGVKQNGSPASSTSSKSVSPSLDVSPEAEAETAKRKRGRPPKLMARYNVKRTRRDSSEFSGGENNDSSSSLKIVFSKVGKAGPSSSSSVSPTVASPTESRESSVSRDTDVSDVSFTEVTSTNKSRRSRSNSLPGSGGSGRKKSRSKR